VIFINRIKQLREERHMTQLRLSIELSVSQESVSAYEKGKYYPSFQTLLKLAEIFGCGIDYIMGLSENRYSEKSKNDQDELILMLLSKLNDSKKEKAIAYIEGLSEN